MSFAASRDEGGFEYSGSGLGGLFAQRRNLLRPRFWRMLLDLRRFYRNAAREAERGEWKQGTLGEFLEAQGYGEHFANDHLLPMAAAIWSCPADQILHYPAGAFLRFFENHGLLKLRHRPVWRSVAGGSRSYVERMLATAAINLRLNRPIRRIQRCAAGPQVIDATGMRHCHDHVVIACHSDQALRMLEQPTPAERRLLGAIRYQPNVAVLHADPALMPKRRRAWASWNVVEGEAPARSVSVTYWMNRLQRLAAASDIFVSLNPAREPGPASIVARFEYEHPMFDAAALAAQDRLWTLQGQGGVWFAGAYFGAGFHEDGLQAGLAVAEAIGQVRRPWSVANESGRIRLIDGGLTEGSCVETARILAA
jgi:hypothetical protein